MLNTRPATTCVSGTWWPSRRAHALSRCAAASAHSELFGLVETVRSCSRRIAATNRPSSGGCVFNRSDFGESTPGCGRGVGGVGHRVPLSGWLHVWSRSSVLVIVANSDSVLSMIASPYSVGIPATASRGTTTRYAALTASMTTLGIAIFSETPTTTMVDTPRLRSTASRSVSAHRADAVPPAEDEIGWLRP